MHNHRCNLQKLTCKLLQERSIRLEQQQASSPIDNYNQSKVVVNHFNMEK